ncbi:hypothetical protein COX95_01965 [bacterium CG_4_10_14_0_2_um_filter_33_32]|nr:MAG: hypothetical protein AUJ93_04410 [bacterium CG2_30_33_46]PIR67751.1 MAG: hypothetical protein COU50_01815 [bacterium CG10_big_fil_rev_8_21_14_0_10_33_18]PIU77186.1 MAG: hypothetical protein COS74_00020 [bacterium CG06_land_8_20_14_3_00_33_50]PIW80994.1 MAG: hypothetical protein COZ97_04225 [bacterium CG_4_8_14_3_um_filter_33_28]PIY85267.1 MAG: hypothetical protein COY76_02950 [bacterium CG_4_10_14_0_8_um_filter_33_57]PIZ86206.1 MAG: hypothetical protein COX95_01965 [bacterium CG_4_10_1
MVRSDIGRISELQEGKESLFLLTKKGFIHQYDNKVIIKLEGEVIKKGAEKYFIAEDKNGK